MIYIPKLDGLRAVSIAFVLIEHLMPGGAKLGLGSLGVEIFFTLSGYLITRTLLDIRDRHLPYALAAESFYWKRFLRLTPALYLAIAICAVFGIANMRANWWIHGLYLTNFKMALDEQWGPATHLWSLAVEEQFYLIWFSVVVIFPRRVLLPSLIVGLVVPIFFRAISANLDLPLLNVLIFGVSDFLCMGGLIAYLEKSGSNLKANHNNFRVFCIAACFAIFACERLIYPVGVHTNAGFNLSRLLLCAALVCLCIDQHGGRFSSWLSWRPVRHVGQISYGLYVYHDFMPPTLRLLGGEIFAGVGNHYIRAILYLVLQAALAFIMAELSWYLLEQPISSFRQSVPSSWFHAPN